MSNFTDIGASFCHSGAKYLLVSSSSDTRVETQYTRIDPGALLVPKTFWISPSGKFAFGLYPQGLGNVFVVAIWLVRGESRTVVWTARRDDPPVTSNAKIQLTMNGKLVLIDGQGKEKLIADFIAKASFASIFDSGNFALCDNNSNTYGRVSITQLTLC